MRYFRLCTGVIGGDKGFEFCVNSLHVDKFALIFVMI